MPVEVTVVGLGCELDRLFAGQPAALPVPAPPNREDLRELFDTIGAPVRSGQAVLIVVGDWLPPETLERVQTVHSLLETDRVAIYVTDLPPLGASVLAALAAALAPQAMSAGALVGSLDGLSDRLAVLAWVASVAGLRHPEVSIFHHARSALPWTSFGVGVQPDSFIVPLRGSPEHAPITAPAHPVDLLIAPGDDADLEWIVNTVSPALGGAPVRQLPPTLHGAEWWGTAKLVEAVGVPTSLEWLARVALPRAVRPCAWCAEPIVGGPCPFCGDAALTSQRRGQERAAGSVPAGTVAVARRGGYPGQGE